MSDETNSDHPKASKAEQAKEAIKLVADGSKVEDACERLGISVHTYYRHKREAEGKPTKKKVAKVSDAIPTGPVTMRVAAPVDHCPPGYVRVMVKREDLAKIIMMGGL